MAMIDLLFSFTKKSNQVFNAFNDAWKKLRDAKDVSTNLERLYECIAFEHSKQVSFKCTEYFIEKDLLTSIVKLSKMGYKHEVNNFMVKVLFELNKKHFTVLQNSITSVFLEPSPDYLGLSLAYSERVIVYGLEVDDYLIDQLLKYLFTDNIHGEYARASLIYLFSNQKTFEVIDSKGFASMTVVKLNDLYINIDTQIDLYKTILEVLCLYILKSREVQKNKNQLQKCFDTRTEALQNSRYSLTNKLSNLFLNALSLDAVEDITRDIEKILDSLNYEYKNVEVYKRILESNVLCRVEQLIIEEFLKNLEN